MVADEPPLMLPEAPLPEVLPLGLEPGLALPDVDEPVPAEPDIALLSLASPVTLSLQCVAAEISLDGLGEPGDELD